MPIRAYGGAVPPPDELPPNAPATVVDPDLVEVVAGSTAVRWRVGSDGRLHQVGFGAADAPAPPDLPLGLFPLAYPTFGEEPLREPALRVTQADGTTSCRLRVVGISRPSPTDPTTRVHLEDRVAPLEVDLVVRAWPEHHILEQWTEIRNGADRPVVVHRVAAGAPALPGPDPHLTHWGGGWAAEWTPTTERLAPGTKTVASAGGVRPSLVRSPVVLYGPDGGATENEGSVLAATVVWGGDVRFDAEVALHDQVRLLAGHQYEGAERHLEPGERFATPHVLWTWSTAGVGPTSRALHGFVRHQVVRDGARTRATVANTWEAVGFALSPDVLATQIDGAADLGAELFLLDDGWFGSEHPRNDDTTGLGDWEVDRGKLADGLAPLIARTRERGMRFGLWVEPEMVNPASTLYHDHPDWVIAEPGRDRREERSQLVLDLCQPPVRRFVVDTLDRILRDHPDISYLKWDANRDLTEPGSPTTGSHQSHLPVDRVHATWEVMAEVARRHPHVELMLCASGGGRSDLGTLRSFHELWTSDNTDPVDRVRIQWGASHLLPASVLGAHVTRWGQRPVAFACAVAMSGRFGFDVDVAALTADERAVAREATARYHRIRDVVQHGELHRLVSPVDTDRAALAFVAPDGSRSVLFAYVLPDAGRSSSAGRSGRPAPVVLDRVPWPGPGRSGRALDLTPGLPEAEVTLRDGTVAWPDGDAPVARVVEVEHAGP